MRAKTILQTIRRNKRFLISTHVNPDPDALCSELALADCLRALGKSVSIVNLGTIPKRYLFLPGAKRIQNFWKNRRVKYDVAIVVDCGDLDRVGKVQELFDPDKILINIDHHVTNDKFGRLNLVLPRASSTCEVLFELFKAGRFKINGNIAKNLYMGIMTDTGSFRYESTTWRTHEIVSELMKYDVSAPEVYRKLYETISYNDLKQFTGVINQFDEHCNKRVACVTLRKKDLRKFSENIDLRDMIFKFLRSIKGMEVFVILTEVGRTKTRVNFRSSRNFDVAKLAGSFDGGGHRRASGCTVNMTIPAAKKEVLKRIRKKL